MTPQGKNLGFKRNSYRLLGCEKGCVLLHYIGDYNIGSQYPHGNSKGENARPYIRTCPSVVQSISTIKDSPPMYTNVYSTDFNMLTKLATCLSTRNSQQVENIQVKQRQSFHLTHDTLYNLHKLANDLAR